MTASVCGSRPTRICESRFCFPYTITIQATISCPYDTPSICIGERDDFYVYRYGFQMLYWIIIIIIIYKHTCTARGAVSCGQVRILCCPPDSCCGMSHRVCFFLLFLCELHTASVFRSRRISTFYIYLYIIVFYLPRVLIASRSKLVVKWSIIFYYIIIRLRPKCGWTKKKKNVYKLYIECVRRVRYGRKKNGFRTVQIAII